ncbi:MAG TPA: lysoplasmalogenase family protein, partial [Pyrinomonadaceae bacterium]|nr:lysoplasmalogenase family protein [Pyrinomonadaceae bacterium]
MRFNFLLADSLAWSLLFFVLVVIAVFTQLAKTTSLRWLPVWPRAVIKAAPALFLCGFSCYLDQQLVSLAFAFCAAGDILLDLPEEKVSWAFNAGALAFAAALVCFSIASYGRPLPGRALWPLSLTNVVIAIFILRWVLPKLKGAQRILEVSYFGILIIANVIASTSYVPIFLGSSLWLMSDLSIGLSTNISGTPANSLDTLGLYDLGLYFLAVGFLNL